MPHITLQYTDNIVETANFHDLFNKIHARLAETLPTDREQCKSSAVKLDNYFIANGDKEHAFVSMEIRVLSGRTPDTLNFAHAEVMAVLKNYFKQSASNLKLQITLEIRELSPYYMRFSSKPHLVSA